MFSSLHPSDTAHTKFVNCLVKTMQLCHYKDELTEIQLREKYRQQSTKAHLCLYEGTELELPMMMLNGSSNCNSSFGSDAFTCLKAFKEKVAAQDFSDPSLCQ